MTNKDFDALKHKLDISLDAIFEDKNYFDSKNQLDKLQQYEIIELLFYYIVTSSDKLKLKELLKSFEYMYYKVYGEEYKKFDDYNTSKYVSLY